METPEENKEEAVVNTEEVTPQAADCTEAGATCNETSDECQAKQAAAVTEEEEVGPCKLAETEGLTVEAEESKE